MKEKMLTKLERDRAVGQVSSLFLENSRKVRTYDT